MLTGTGRFDVIAAADTSSETSLLRTIEQIRVLRGVNRVQSWRHLQIVKESYPRITQLDKQNPHLEVTGPPHPCRAGWPTVESMQSGSTGTPRP